MSLYLQISDPGSSSSKWDCFASYQLAVRNRADDSKSVRRDSWHRFSAKKRSHGWCDFAALTTLFDPKQGFLGPNGTIQVSTDITILDESVSFTRENDLGGVAPLSSSDVYSGKFVWKVQNFSVFQPLLRTQKIMSPAFPAGECALRMSVYQSSVGGADYLSLCLESKDTERTGSPDRTCWCLFRLAVQPQQQVEGGGRTVHRDSYGRFACDGLSGDNTSLGWNDFMKMDDFLDPGAAYLEGDTAVFSSSFHVIRESTSLLRHVEPRGLLLASGGGGGPSVLSRPREKRKATARESEWAGRFQWRLENFTRLKDLLKKRKITGLCIKSRRFTVGGRDCRLIVYPRGQSQPPTFLSVFLEVTDPSPPSPDWTCFVSHRLSVINQRGDSDRSVSKESQNRYSKSAKDWGWREFVSLTTLFDADAGFLVNDAVVFSAEVLVLKESNELKKLTLPKIRAVPRESGSSNVTPAATTTTTTPTTTITATTNTTTTTTTTPTTHDAILKEDGSALDDDEVTTTWFTWRIENFLAFKDVVETRKIFSKFFSAGPCDVRVGLYESFDSLCVYLESDATAAPSVPPTTTTPTTDGSASSSTDKPVSYWVTYRAAILNQRYPERTQWREGSVYTRSWNNSVLQFPRITSGGGGGGNSASSSSTAAAAAATSTNDVVTSTTSTAFHEANSNGHGGLLLRDSLAVAVEILEWRPWSQETDGAPPSATAAPLTPGGASAGQRADAAAVAGGSSAAVTATVAAAAAVGRASPLDEEEEGDDGDDDSTDGGGTLDTDDDDDNLTEDDDDDEEYAYSDAEGNALKSWLHAAGLEFLEDNHPPLMGDVESVKKTLEGMLLSQPRAIPMFVASLRMYMSCLPRVKCLLLPCLTTAASSSMTTAARGAICGVGRSVITILAELPCMRVPLIIMLVDVMMDCSLSAKFNCHVVGSHCSSSSGGGSDDGESTCVENGEENEKVVVSDGTGTTTDTTGATPVADEAIANSDLVVDDALCSDHMLERTLSLILGWLHCVGKFFFFILIFRITFITYFFN